MIVLDIETSGVDFEKCGVWQIGAVDLETGDEFLEEGRIDEEDLILDSPQAKLPVLECIGKTENDLRDKNKQSQEELIEKFFNWAKKCKINNLICQHPQFDFSFLSFKAKKYGLEIPYHYSALDLHTLSELRYFLLNNKFPIQEVKNRINMGLKEILVFCGMKDNRKAHNALEDAKLTAECFNRLVYGKNLFPEFAKFKIPEYLRK